MFKDFSIDQSELHALISEAMGKSNDFNGEIFILKSENTALQKNIEALESELAESIEKDD